MNKKAFLLALLTVIVWISGFVVIRASLLGGYSRGHLGMFVGIIGIFLITIGSEGTTFTITKGVLIILIASIATSIFFVFQKKPIETLSSNRFNCLFHMGDRIQLIGMNAL
jgi:hypothetical protein